MMKIFRQLNPYQIVLLSYGVIIMIGTFLLMLPVSVQGIPPLTFIDALFMSASSVCVSGLSIFDMGKNFSIFGQIVVIILVQIGALGIMTITTILAVIMGRRIQLRDRLLIQESLQRWSVAGVVRLVIVIVKMTFFFEFIGGLVLTVIFWSDYGFSAVYYGFWHATSAFCNAGFDILGGSNISNYILNPLFNAVLLLEVICGGLGFAVLLDIYQKRYWKKFGINTKIVLATTAILILIGTAFIFILEYNNEGTLAPYNIFEKIMASLFMASMSRTSGFSMLDMNALTEPTLLFIMFLMFIGGSPASTGGGIKTTTIAVIFAAIWSLIRGRDDVVIFERTVPPIVIFRALSIFFVSASVVFLTTMFLCLTEDIPLGKIFFEAVSMFSTVGLPTGTVSEMQPLSRVVIIFVMLMGRIGIISFGMALVIRKKKQKIRYPEDKFIIG